MDIALVVAGALTGFTVGLTGVGGGSLMTPILLLIFGMAPLTAVGTDLWFAAITKLFAMRVHHNLGLIDWLVAKRLWSGSLVSSALTLTWMKFYPPKTDDMHIVTLTIAGVIVSTAIGILFQKPLPALSGHFRTDRAEKFKTLQAPLTVVAGAVLGILVTITSIGAGTLGAIFLLYLYPLRLTPSRLIATDIVHAIPLAIFAGMGHLFMGNVNFALLGNLLLGSIPAVIIGAKLSARLPHAWLRTALAVVLILITLTLWWV